MHINTVFHGDLADQESSGDGTINMLVEQEGRLRQLVLLDIGDGQVPTSLSDAVIALKQDVRGLSNFIEHHLYFNSDDRPPEVVTLLQQLNILASKEDDIAVQEFEDNGNDPRLWILKQLQHAYGEDHLCRMPFGFCAVKSLMRDFV